VSKYARGVRVLACVLAAAVVFVPSAGATPRGLKLLVRDGPRLALVYLDRVVPFTQPLTPTGGALAFSGDGRLISIGGTIVGRAHLPTKTLVWAPTGERAAYTTTQGAVVLWTPAGRRTIEPNGWATPFFGSLTLAWSEDGTLAVSRGSSLWSWRDGVVRELVHSAPADTSTGGPAVALPVAWAGDQVLWWDWPGSGSVASDGVSLYEGDRKLGTMLMYRDWLAVCGTHVAFSAGHDRESMDDKTVLLDGRDVSRDSRRSWASLACGPGGRLVASASRNLVPTFTNQTHRAIWQLLPVRRQLTRPPWGWSDEEPQVFPNGAILFVRSRASARKLGTNEWLDVQKGRVMLLEHGTLRQVAEIGFRQRDDVYTYPVQYYGHYDWTQFLAVSP